MKYIVRVWSADFGERYYEFWNIRQANDLADRKRAAGYSAHIYQFVA